MTTDQTIEKISDLRPFIEYLQNTREDEWAVDVVRTKEGANCMFGHLVNWFYGKGYEGSISLAWDFFEEIWMTTYVIYLVNDGENPRYQQSTPKQRVIAYLSNLWLGLEPDTSAVMAEDAARYGR